MSEPVRKLKAPVRLEYTVTAGLVLSRFLAGVVEGRRELWMEVQSGFLLPSSDVGRPEMPDRRVAACG